MPTALIIGASRGLGDKFVQLYAGAGWTVHGTVRSNPPADTDAVKYHTLEVTDDSSLATLAQTLSDVTFDLVVVNAGVIGSRSMTADKVDRDLWMHTLAVNTVAPLAVAGAFLPNLRRSDAAKLIAISSRLGSIGFNTVGGQYIYRSSKAGLNAVWRSLAIDTKGDKITCAVLHPGWVKTDMGGQGADITPDESVGGMVAVIDKLTLDDSGKFFDYRGQELPW
jgi:NAD(P)-dependent dehydrogenase (short-subunit alcohol dehydrogenase family)